MKPEQTLPMTWLTGMGSNPHGRFIPQKSYKHTKNSMRTTVLTNRSTLFFQCKGFRTAGTGNRWRTAKGRGER